MTNDECRKNDEAPMTNCFLRHSSLNSETTASGRGRVEALPFRREQRLHENPRAVRARVVVRDAAWPIQKMSKVRWKPLRPPTFADASGSRSVSRRAAVSPTPPLGGLPDTTPYGGGASFEILSSFVIRHSSFLAAHQLFHVRLHPLDALFLNPPNDCAAHNRPIRQPIQLPHMLAA